MKYFHKILICCFMLLSVSLVPARAGEKVSLNIWQLHAHPISQVMRQTFDAYYFKNGTINQYANEVNGLLPYMPRFSEKFVVLGIQEGGFGGDFVTILISPRNMAVWQVWLYRIDNHEYQIRQIRNFPLSQDERKQFAPLRSQKYHKAWL